MLATASGADLARTKSKTPRTNIHTGITKMRYFDRAGPINKITPIT